MVEYLQKGYAKFAHAEEFFTSSILVVITALVFTSAVARTLHHPINWAVDFSLLLFAWEVFLGGDIAVRNTNLVGVEILANKLPPRIQKTLKIVCFFLIIGFCILLTVYGIKLCLENTKRLFQVLPISYSWCTLSVPVGSFLMMVSASIRIHELVYTPVSYWEWKKEKDV